MLIKKLKQYFTPFGFFIKLNWKALLTTQLLVLITSFAGYSTLPFLRAINQTWGIIFAVIYIFFAILTFVTINKVVTKHFKNTPIEDKCDTVRFFYFFVTLVVTGTTMTTVFVTIRAVNPNTEYLKQGIFGIIFLVIYYILFGCVIYLDKIIPNKKER